MSPVLVALLPLLIPILFGASLSLIGVSLERKHEADLTAREATVGSFLLVDTKAIPADAPATFGTLVTGNVVIGTGYLKQLTASFRSFFGGEIKGYQRVMERGRREAQMRMIESARNQGAHSIINVRFETADVGGAKPFAEVFCYGTMIR